MVALDGSVVLKNSNSLIGMTAHAVCTGFDMPIAGPVENKQNTNSALVVRTQHNIGWHSTVNPDEPNTKVKKLSMPMINFAVRCDLTCWYMYSVTLAKKYKIYERWLQYMVGKWWKENYTASHQNEIFKTIRFATTSFACVNFHCESCTIEISRYLKADFSAHH